MNVRFYARYSWNVVQHLAGGGRFLNRGCQNQDNRRRDASQPCSSELDVVRLRFGRFANLIRIEHRVLQGKQRHAYSTEKQLTNQFCLCRSHDTSNASDALEYGWERRSFPAERPMGD
jgi:hypothetical protein